MEKLCFYKSCDSYKIIVFFIQPMRSLWKAIYLGRVYFIVQSVFVCICIWAFISVVIGFEWERAVFVKCQAKCLSSCYRKRWVTSVAIMFLSFIVLLTSIFSISLFCIPSMSQLYTHLHTLHPPTNKDKMDLLTGSLSDMVQWPHVTEVFGFIWVFTAGCTPYLSRLTTDPLNISPAPYSHFISIHLHSRLIRLSVKPLRPLSWNQTNP